MIALQYGKDKTGQKDVHGADIARAIGVSQPTVCVSLKALEEKGYILMDDAREVHLTENGMRIAEETYERRREEISDCRPYS